MRPGLKSALILAHGDRPSYELLLRLRSTAGLFIATDGAANELAALGLPPDVVFGDFDSISNDLNSRLPHSEFVPAPDQEASDLDKAIEYAISRGYKQIIVTGAAGGRMDHTLANASLLLKYLEKAEVRLTEDRWEAWAVRDRSVIEGKPGDTLSLIAFSSIASVTLSGVRWPLHGEPMAPGSRGVSNVLVAPQANLQVEGGALLVVHQESAE